MWLLVFISPSGPRVQLIIMTLGDLEITPATGNISQLILMWNNLILILKVNWNISILHIGILTFASKSVNMCEYALSTGETVLTNIL